VTQVAAAARRKGKAVFLTPQSAIEFHLSALRKRLAELDEKLVPNRDGKIDRAVSDAMVAVEARIADLERLRASALAGEGVTSLQIAVAAGEKKPPQIEPISRQLHSLRLPRAISTAAERAAYAAKVKQRSADPDPLSSAQRERMNALHAEFTEDALVRIGAKLDDYREAAGESKNAVVAYTEGANVALTLLLADLWADLRSCIAYNREERLALEARVADLEARGSIEYRGIWAADTKYKSGNAVTHDGSMWIATADTQGVRPGDTAFWKLAVKRGRDGRDAR
jgi:hypothetical protein